MMCNIKHAYQNPFNTTLTLLHQNRVLLHTTMYTVYCRTDTSKRTVHLFPWKIKYMHTKTPFNTTLTLLNQNRILLHTTMYTVYCRTDTSKRTVHLFPA